MRKVDIEKIISSFRKKSEQGYKYGDEKCAYFERIADQIEDNIFLYEDDSFESEEDIIADVKEAFAEVDDLYDNEEDY